MILQSGFGKSCWLAFSGPIPRLPTVASWLAFQAWNVPIASPKNTVRFFIKYPEREASWTTFLETFHFDVWVSLLLLVLLMMVCLYITQLFKPREEIEEESFNLSNTPLAVCGTLLGQGSFVEPKDRRH